MNTYNVSSLLLAEDAMALYIRTMSSTTSNNKKTLNGLELRNRHCEARMVAVDYFRINSTQVQASATWKLELDIDAVFIEIRTAYRSAKQRRPSFVAGLERRGSRGITLL